MAGFHEVYARLCERWPDPQERGRRFEPLVKQVLETDPVYRRRFAKVWLWSEWPGGKTGDLGVDLVAELRGGGLAAIQAKCYDPDRTLYKSDVDSFLAHDEYDEYYLFTTNPISANLAAQLGARKKIPQICNFFGLEATAIDWNRYLEDETLR